MPRRQRHSTAGFTLLEVLLALVLGAILLASLALSLHAAFKAQRSVERALPTAKASRLALTGLSRRIQAALPPTGVLAGAFTGSDSSDDTGLDSDSLSFCNSDDPSSHPQAAGDVQAITIALVAAGDLQTGSDDGLLPGAPTGAEGGGGVLVARVRRNLPAQVEETPVDQVLCRRVQSFNLRYYDGSQWVDSWDSTAQDNALPLAVEISLEIAGAAAAGSSPAYRVTTVLQLPCATPVDSSLDQLAQGSSPAP